MDRLSILKRQIKLSLGALLAAILLLLAQPGLSPAETAGAELPMPQLYAEPLPAEADSALPELLSADRPLPLRSGWADSCMWEAELPAGSSFYIIQPWAVQGLYHMILAGERTWYVSTGELDLSRQYGYVFNARQDMHTLSGYSAKELEGLLQGGLSGLGAAFAQAEEQYGVNALLLVAICRLESGWADSYLAVNYHNLAGLGGPGGWMRFDSHSDCIDYLAKALAERYLNPDSAFYHGCTIAGICRTYCGGSGHWTNSVTRYMQSFSEELLAAKDSPVRETAVADSAAVI